MRQLFELVRGNGIDERFEFERLFAKGLHLPARRAPRCLAEDQVDFFTPIQKTFFDLEPDDLQFTVPGDAALYIIIFENVTNESGIAWNDFHYTLGYGVENQFVQSGAGDGLGFVGLGPGLLNFGFPVDQVPYSSVFTEYEMLEDSAI